MSSHDLVIGFDTTQNERGRLNNNYWDVRNILEADGFLCKEIDEFPLTLEALQPYQIVVFSCPDASRFRDLEVASILDYVAQGGNILLLNHAGGDRGRRTNLDAITHQCGISFNNDQVLDPKANLEAVDAYPLITHFQAHPIFQDVEALCLRIGCSLSVTGDALALAFTSKNANSPQQPVVGLVQHAKGRIIAIGSYEMFRDDELGGISYVGNAQFLRNLACWLTTTPEDPLSNGNSSLTNLPDPTPITLSRNLKTDLLQCLKKQVNSNIKDENNLSTPAQVIQLTKSTEESEELMGLKAQITALKAEVKELQDAHQTLLKENNMLGEKLRVFELNLTDFPIQALAEIPVEMQDTQSSIKKLAKKVTAIERNMGRIHSTMEALAQKIEVLSDQIESFNITLGESSETPPLITTADALLAQSPSQPINHAETPPIQANTEQYSQKLDAFQQMLQLLQVGFENGTIRKDEYLRKRAKYEQKIAALQ